MLGKRVVANISDPAARLIFLEEHCRNLEQVPHLECGRRLIGRWV
jgi:hypothetical protein